MTEPGKQIQRWADVAMYSAAHNEQAERGEPIEPKVYLVSMTTKPLQVMAAAAELYAGRIVTRPEEISRETAVNWFSDMSKTALQAPLEFIDFHFMFEGVTRAFTHQLVRQRTAVFVQESQRFAVKENASFEVGMPPSISCLKDDDPKRVLWEKSVTAVTNDYRNLINAGVPAEDARGLLPTNITTRVHYKTNLRNLAEHAGMRLCSQAQYEWKQVWYGIIKAVLAYGPADDRWQQHEIGKLFKPVCYRTGKCEFMAETDRHCSIRSRVMSHHANGEGPDTWDDIDPREPLMEGAARFSPDMASDMQRRYVRGDE
jgi:flavin-dependent thymidylate synthase